MGKATQEVPKNPRKQHLHTAHTYMINPVTQTQYTNKNINKCMHKQWKNGNMIGKKLLLAMGMVEKLLSIHTLLCIQAK